MRLIEYGDNYSYLFADFLSKNIPEALIGNNSIYIPKRVFNKKYKLYYDNLVKGSRKFGKYLDELLKKYKKISIRIDDLSQGIKLSKEIFREFIDISIMFYAMCDAVLDNIKVDAKDRYEYFYLLTTPFDLSFSEMERRDLLEIALMIERNKTLKKSFSSSPEKIMDKINTFYINIYNTIVHHKKNYSWIKTNPAYYEDYTMDNLIRDIKVLIRDVNIKREYQDIKNHIPMLKKSFGRVRRKLTKKLLNISESARKISLLRKLKNEFLYSYFYSLMSLFRDYKVSINDLFNTNSSSLGNLFLGKKITYRKGNLFYLKGGKVTILSNKSFQKKISKSVYHCIANFDERLKGTLGKDIVAIEDFRNNIDFDVLSSSKCILVDNLPSVFTYYYKYTKKMNIAYGTGILSKLSKGPVKVENKKISYVV